MSSGDSELAEHFFQLLDIQLCQGMVGTFPQYIIMCQNVVIIFLQRNGGEVIMLRVLPDSGADEKAVAVCHNVLTAGTVIDGDHAFGRLLEKMVDGGGGIVIKAAEALRDLGNNIRVIRDVGEALLRVGGIVNGVSWGLWCWFS